MAKGNFAHRKETKKPKKSKGFYKSNATFNNPKALADMGLVGSNPGIPLNQGY